MELHAAKVWAKGMERAKNCMLLFRIKREGLRSVVLRLAAENTYQVYVFDAFLTYGPARAAHGYTRMEEFDLTPFLRDGELVATAVIVGNNINSYCAADDAPFFAAQLLSEGNVIASTEDFEAYIASDRVVKTQRYSFQRVFSESYRMRGDRRGFFLGREHPFARVETAAVEGNRILERHVAYPEYHEIDASKTGGYGTVTLDNARERARDRALNDVGGQFAGYIYDELEDRLSDTASCMVFAPELPENGGGWQLYDFGSNYSGFLGVDVTVRTEADLYVLWDEILLDDGSLNFFRMQTCNVVRWRLTPGEYRLLSFEPYTMRYAKVAVLEGEAKIDRLYLKTLENPEAVRLGFACADAQLKAIVEAARSTFAQNAGDYFTDCPSRERGGWLCDSYFTGQAEQLFTGKNAVEQSFLENYRFAPQDPNLPAGMIAMCYPSDNHDTTYIPNWAKWFILELASYLRRTGDRETIDGCREKVLALLSFFTRYENEYGLLEKLESWVFIEWSRAAEFTQDVSFPSNMLYCGMLDAAAELYDLPAVRKKAGMLRTVIREWSLRGDFFADSAVRENGALQTTTNTTETCQYYAFYFGVATPKTDSALLQRLLKDFGARRDVEHIFPEVYKSNAFIGNFLRLDYLRRIGLATKAMAECRDYFGFMASRTGTLWEHDSTSASCCHGFASYAANILIEGLTGFVSADAQKREVKLSPCAYPVGCTVTVPVGGGTFTLTVENGVLRTQLPEGYVIIWTEGTYRID